MPLPWSPLKLAYTVATRSTTAFVDSTATANTTNLVICHGLLGNKRNWSSLAKSLVTKCRAVYCIDARNHGHSPRDPNMTFLDMGKDLVDFVEQHELSNVCLLGHSMSGKAAMCASLLQPNLFSKLIVVDISPVYTSETDKMLSMIDLMASVDLTRYGKDSSLAVIRDLLNCQWKDLIPDPITRNFLLTNLDHKDDRLFWRCNLDAIRANWKNLIGFPSNIGDANAFDGPSLFVAGGRSNYLRRDDLPAIRRLFPTARLVGVPQAGHWVHYDAPDTMLELVSQFIANANVSVEGVVDL